MKKIAYVSAGLILALSLLSACGGSVPPAVESTSMPVSVPTAAPSSAPETQPSPTAESMTADKAVGLVQEAMSERGESASVMVPGSEETIDGEHCFLIDAGNNSADGGKFTAMYHYAVSDSGRIWYMDVVQGPDWIEYVKGAG
jgi:hypothetical protein